MSTPSHPPTSAPPGAPTWIDLARAALAATRAGRGEPDGETRVLPGVKPPLFDALAGLAALPLAALVWGAAAFRETVVGEPTDAIALLLRAAALAVTLRALLALRAFLRRLGLWLRAEGYGLALRPDGLVYRTPTEDVVVPAGEVAGVREPGDWPSRSAARVHPVYVLRVAADGPTPLAIPPVLAGGPGVVAEALMRLPRAERARPAAGEAGAARLPSRLYDDAARGAPGEGVLAFRHGAVWLARAPKATMLLGLAMLEGLVRSSVSAQRALAPTLLAVALFATIVWPLVWALGAYRHVRVRKGLALVLAPEALLLRTRAGVLVVPWPTLARARVERRRAWSLSAGVRTAATLVLERRDDAPIRYDEAFLGTPVDLVALAVEAYRKGDVDPTHAGRVVRVPLDPTV